MIRILSFDGGGIMGLFTTTILERLAEAHPQLIQRADMLAGASTGGIIALGLADGLSPADISTLYRTKAAKIFDDSIWDNLKDLGNAIGADYSPKNLAKELRTVFGARTLADLPKRVLVPAFDLMAEASDGRPTVWKPKFFHNYPGPDSDGAESIVDVALRTSAAPTYFPSHQGYIDGGVVANNPSMAAVAQALDPRAADGRLTDIVLLAVGTGMEPKFIKGQTLDWGWGEWARPLVSLMISGVMGVADFQCRLLLGDRYRRVDEYLPEPFNLDEKRSGRLDWLVDRAKEVDLDGIVEWLRTHWS
ncbi:MAG TPA: patatin-like phospholipase family protein [Phycisphaerales bacterium]|nr:patatin-like phospholipase family protein [Phycisphaerales bacterium]